jgi:hypothetical protein
VCVREARVLGCVCVLQYWRSAFCGRALIFCLWGSVYKETRCRKSLLPVSEEATWNVGTCPMSNGG